MSGSRSSTTSCSPSRSAPLRAPPSLDRLLAELPNEQREAIRARVLEERAYADIASQLRCSPQVVRQRVSRGLRTLRTRMEQQP